LVAVGVGTREHASVLAGAPLLPSLRWLGPTTSFGGFASRNIRGGFSLWLRLATVLDPVADAHCRGMDAGCSLEALSRDALLVLATVCALVACATISGMRPTVL